MDIHGLFHSHILSLTWNALMTLFSLPAPMRPFLEFCISSNTLLPASVSFSMALNASSLPSMLLFPFLFRSMQMLPPHAIAPSALFSFLPLLIRVTWYSSHSTNQCQVSWLIYHSNLFFCPRCQLSLFSGLISLQTLDPLFFSTPTSVPPNGSNSEFIPRLFRPFTDLSPRHTLQPTLLKLTAA